MKYITLIIGLLVVGCGKTEEEKVLGEYEFKEDGMTFKYVYRENDVKGYYVNGKKIAEYKWTIVNGEIHTINVDGSIDVVRINKDDSITQIAWIIDGKRTDIPKENEVWTYKKIK